jgi:hypothetical protein
VASKHKSNIKLDIHADKSVLMWGFSLPGQFKPIDFFQQTGGTHLVTATSMTVSRSLAFFASSLKR